MLRLRPYKKDDADTIISWSRDERAFYKWSAGVMGAYPITAKEFAFVDSIMAFTVCDEDKAIGFFTFRNPGGRIDELRIGFVILDPEQRGSGKGKEMMKLALKYAFEIYGATKVTLGVFENNEPAYFCYRSAGFTELPETDTYQVLGEEWKCIEMAIEREPRG